MQLGHGSEVTAVIPTLGRNRVRLEKCIKSILDSTGKGSFSVLVILNDSSVHLNLPEEVDVHRRTV